ncbi:MAG: response regulator, partial [Flavobacteriaceae bacterium]|nr:response regulator [Flavobacteriaceae bacterium]
ILIVEDNKVNQMITKKILEQKNIQSNTVNSGEEAVKHIEENPDYDLILMDIHMPGISGFEATKRIRAFNTEIPIIALTAVVISDNIDEFYEAGFDDVIPKPYVVKDFFNKIYKAFENYQVL